MKTVTLPPNECPHPRVADIPSRPTANADLYPFSQPEFERCFDCGCTRLKAHGFHPPGAWRLPWTGGVD